MESRLSKHDAAKQDFLVNLDENDNLGDICEKIMSKLKPVVVNVQKHGGDQGSSNGIFLLGVYSRGLKADTITAYPRSKKILS